MNVSLIWHIVKKDFRHTWMWIVAVFLSFAGWGVTSSMEMLAPLETRRSTRDLPPTSRGGAGLV